MRNSDRNLVFGLLLTFGLGIVALFVFQSVWLGVVQTMLLNSQGTSLPTSPTMPVSGLTFPTTGPPVRIGVESTLGNVAITVTRVFSPADFQVARYATYSILEEGEEFLMVDVNVRCLSTAQESCRLTEFDFGVRSAAGHDYPSEFSSSFDMNGMFEGGEIEPGKSESGALIFAVRMRERGLTLYYPKLFAFGGEARFILTD